MILARPLRRLLGRPAVFSHFHTALPLYASRKVIQQFKLADIGEGITECEVIKWSVKQNATVAAFDPLCEVQSDKASVEITSPFDGVVTEFLVKEGDVAKVGEGLCLIEIEEEGEGGSRAETEEKPASPPSHQKQVKPSPDAREVELQESLSEVEVPRRKHPLDPNFDKVTESTTNTNILATPFVRHFARQKGVDLGKICSGSGKGGRIEKQDVETFLAGSSSVSSDIDSASAVQSTSKVETSEDAIVELGRTRYGMWKVMEKSLEIPHFGYSTMLDLTALHELLPTLNANIPPHFLPPSPPKPLAVNPASIYPLPTPPPIPDTGRYSKLTYLPILLKMLAKSMQEWPLLRSSITPHSTSGGGKPTLTVRANSDISIALSTPSGLYTPTMMGVNTLSAFTIASRLRHLAHLGRQTPPALTPAEMPKKGGTVTVSNVGALGGGEFASPVLVPGGGVAIVAIGRAKWVWDVERKNREGGWGERRLKVGVSWSADHRVVEGAELAAFVECWRAYVEQPGRLIADSV